jgi:hypothetical protein
LLSVGVHVLGSQTAAGPCQDRHLNHDKQAQRWSRGHRGIVSGVTTAVQVILEPGASRTDVEAPIRTIMHADLAALPSFIIQLTQGTFPVW